MVLWKKPVDYRSLVFTGLLIKTKIKCMRQISTLFACLILFLSTVYAQNTGNFKTPGLEILKRSLPLATSNSETVIRRRCSMATPLNDKPLLVIDGIVVGDAGLKNFNPDDIESIWILKDHIATALYGCYGFSGVILIKTKNADQRTIQIKDFVSGEALPSANVDLISKEQNRDTIHMIADATGKIVTNKIVYGNEYELLVSRIGYKPFKMPVNSKIIGKNYLVLLERNYKELNEIVISTLIDFRRKNFKKAVAKVVCECLEPTSESNTDPEIPCNGKRITQKVRIYPNPALRSQKINIEFESKQGKVTVKLFSLDYKLINAKEYEATNGINRISFFINPRLSSGMYIIQLFDEMNYLVNAERLIVQ